MPGCAQTNSLAERLADVGGQLQKLRWEALDCGAPELAADIAHAIDAVAWAAGVHAPNTNVVDPPGGTPVARGPLNRRDSSVAA